MIQLSQYDAVIFDMDGVLIDSEPLWKVAMEEVFHSLGSKLTKADFQKTVGLRIDEVVHFWNHQENWEVKNEKDVEEAIIVKMIELISTNAAPLSGVIETLTYLKNSGLKIGLGTSSSSRLIEVVLSELNIKHFFDCTHSAETEAFGKPHPAVYLTVAQQLNVSPNKCLVIEDSFNGVIAGLAAKMKVVCIPEKTHFPNARLSVADFHFDTMNDFLLEIQK
jgi:sugar-phosphatase